jgi:hypothetical protein
VIRDWSERYGPLAERLVVRRHLQHQGHHQAGWDMLCGAARAAAQPTGWLAFNAGEGAERFSSSRRPART